MPPRGAGSELELQPQFVQNVRENSFKPPSWISPSFPHSGGQKVVVGVWPPRVTRRPPRGVHGDPWGRFLATPRLSWGPGWDRVSPPAETRLPARDILAEDAAERTDSAFLEPSPPAAAGAPSLFLEDALTASEPLNE